MKPCIDSTDVLTVAEALTNEGTCVIPIPNGEKAPRTPGWQKLRLVVADLHDSISSKNNLGVLLGEPSNGLVDVDIDHPLLKNFVCWLPHTDRVHGRSGNPASHYWYRIESGIPKPIQLKGPDGKMLVELRSTGQQTVVPPSAYRLANNTVDHLRWERPGKPAIVEQEILESALHKAAAATLLALNWPQQGGRHDVSLALAGALLRNGWDVSEVEDFIERAAEAAGDEEAEKRAGNVVTTHNRIQSNQTVKGIPSLKTIIDEKVVDLVCTWLALSKEHEAEQHWPEPVLLKELELPDLSADLLPSPYKEFTKSLALSLEVPEGMIILCILSIVSAACTKKFLVAPRSDWQEPINLYTLVAMPPANNKSLVLKKCTTPLLLWEISEDLKINQQRLKAKSEQKNLEIEIQNLRNKLKNTNDTKSKIQIEADILNAEYKLDGLVIPPTPKLFVNDVTPESLANAVYEQDGRLAILSDEGGFFENIAGLYTGGKANNDIVLKGIDGGDVRIERRDRSVRIKPYLTIAIIAQPKVLKNLGDRNALTGKGIQERFLYLIPKSNLGHRHLQGSPVPIQVENAYIDAVKQLLDVSIQKDDMGMLSARPLTLSDTADQIWQQWRHEIEPMLGPKGELQPCLGWGGKLVGVTLRLAGLLELMETGPTATTISDRTMERAITLARNLIPHALAAFGLMTENPLLELAENVLDKIRDRNEPEITKTEIHRLLHGRIPDVKKLDSVLTLLEDRGILRIREVETTPGKRKTRKVEVNPALLSA